MPSSGLDTASSRLLWVGGLPSHWSDADFCNMLCAFRLGQLGDATISRCHLELIVFLSHPQSQGGVYGCDCRRSCVLVNLIHVGFNSCTCKARRLPVRPRRGFASTTTSPRRLGSRGDLPMRRPPALPRTSLVASGGTARMCQDGRGRDDDEKVMSYEPADVATAENAATYPRRDQKQHDSGTPPTQDDDTQPSS